MVQLVSHREVVWRLVEMLRFQARLSQIKLDLFLTLLSSLQLVQLAQQLASVISSNSLKEFRWDF